VEGLIEDKLSRLRRYLEYLRELKRASLETFSGDFRVRGSAERYLHLAIESVIDISGEIIASLQLPRPERYRDIPRVLAEAEIISKDLSDDIAKMIGFRNLLVHDYAVVNVTLEYRFLNERLPDLEAYMREIAKWLKTNPFKP
jgi:uncharacterized protein YutE (UPF0331/DUF86 family)